MQKAYLIKLRCFNSKQKPRKPRIKSKYIFENGTSDFLASAAEDAGERQFRLLLSSH